jgi:hypothetical protein
VCCFSCTILQHKQVFAHVLSMTFSFCDIRLSQMAPFKGNFDFVRKFVLPKINKFNFITFLLYMLLLKCEISYFMKYLVIS